MWYIMHNVSLLPGIISNICVVFLQTAFMPTTLGCRTTIISLRHSSNQQHLLLQSELDVIWLSGKYTWWWIMIILASSTDHAMSTQRDSIWVVPPGVAIESCLKSCAPTPHASCISGWTWADHPEPIYTVQSTWLMRPMVFSYLSAQWSPTPHMEIYWELVIMLCLLSNCN